MMISILLAGGCALPDLPPEEDLPPPSAIPKASTPPTEAGDPATGCLDIDQALINAIIDGTDMSVSSGMAFRSPEHEEVYLVALQFQVPGADAEAVWATNDLNGAGMILSVNAVAKEFTVWPDASRTGAQISPASPGVAESVACLTD
jgi:hypothetical protein